jgi:hypothetical protein
MYQCIPTYVQYPIHVSIKDQYMKRKQIQATIKFSVWTFEKTRAADPHHLNADLDPFFHFDADPDIQLLPEKRIRKQIVLHVNKGIGICKH